MDAAEVTLTSRVNRRFKFQKRDFIFTKGLTSLQPAIAATGAAYWLAHASARSPVFIVTRFVD